MLEKYFEGKFYVDEMDMGGGQQGLHQLVGVHLGASCSLLMKDYREK